jgi:hypothetical protein
MKQAFLMTILLLPFHACLLDEAEFGPEEPVDEVDVRKLLDCEYSEGLCQFCGDWVCQAGEDLFSCPTDCSECGDGYCGGYEDTQTCTEDCGAACGDGACNGPETVATCIVDCAPELDTVYLDRVLRCRNGFPLPCNSTLSNPTYHWWEDFGVANEKQKRTFIARASEPARAAVRGLVFIAAGQQNEGLNPDLPSQLTGQYDGYKQAFSAKTGSAWVGLAAGSLARRVVEELHVDPDETFIGLAFDARFNYDFSPSNKTEIEDAYYAWLRASFEAQKLESIYLAGHSRGGCLVMRLARRFNTDYPTVPLVVHVFDGVCNHKDGEMGVFGGTVDNPTTNDGAYFARPVNVSTLFKNTSKLRVLNLVSGAEVVDIPLGIGGGVRAFAHSGGGANTVVQVGDWYEQRWSTLGHHSLGNTNWVMSEALAHRQSACQQIGC